MSTAGLRAQHAARRASIGLGMLALLLCVFEVRCTSSSDSSDDGVPFGGSPGERDRSTIRLPGTGQGGQPSERSNPFCGVGACDAETNLGCQPPPASGSGGASGGPGFGGEGGSAGHAGGGAGPEAEFHAGSNYGEACRIVEPSLGCGVYCPRERRCLAAGRGVEFSPCFSASDCEAGLTCIGDGGSGVCRRYCCGATSCGNSGFCETAAEVETGVLVPVCAPLATCSMLDPFPCPIGRVCTCGSERTCAFVKNDGRTGCVVPGKGREGDACLGFNQGECAAGYVCSTTLGCLRICQLDDADACGGGSCQAPADFAVGLGVCVDSGPAAADSEE
jgi:hypothetical protein